MRLIDADTLIEEIKGMFCPDGYKLDFIRKIDNATTVEPEITEKQAILLLINSGWLVNHDKELRKKWERPQGEWEESHIFSCGKILRMRMDVIEHKCKNCGRWSIKWAETIPDNFCSNCGARMASTDRDCENCVHHSDGKGCESWECEFKRRSDV